jgi:HAD superfamily hydrolase (TIGR01509 family)
MRTVRPSTRAPLLSQAQFVLTTSRRSIGRAINSSASRHNNPLAIDGVKIKGILFDFDGVIADSETLANTVLAEKITQLGLPTTLDDALTRYLGKRASEVLALIESGVGRPLPSNFSEDLKMATLARFREGLREVTGATAFIRDFSALPRCIASSSSVERLRVCLEVLGIANDFSGRVFSADMVERGKPHPDLFMYAASRLQVEPASCVVIEDSASGVQAGIAAGMTVIGLCAGSHLKAGHSARLALAGATYLARTWGEVAELVAPRI